MREIEFCWKKWRGVSLKVLALLLTIITGLSLIPVQAQATSVTVEVLPQGTYLHTCGEVAADPTIVDLTYYGFAPGNELRLTYEGTLSQCYSCRVLLPEEIGVLGVFSSSNILGPSPDQHRVPGAIDIGDDFETIGTYFCSREPTDIPEDFRIFPPEGFLIQIPEGATHLFLAIHDSAYSDNTGEIFVTIELVPIEGSLFSDAVWTFPVAILVGIFVVLRRRRKQPPMN